MYCEVRLERENLLVDAEEHRHGFHPGRQACDVTANLLGLKTRRNVICSLLSVLLCPEEHRHSETRKPT